jgi:hypothetical protein
MRVQHMLVPMMIVAMSAPAAGQTRVPTALRHLKPHQVIEAIAAERQTLGFTEMQIRRLDSLHMAVLNEPHRYERAPSPKTHQNVRMAPMVSRQRAFADALTILTPDQRNRAEARFADPEYLLPEQLRAHGRMAKAPTDPLQRHSAAASPASGAVGETTADADQPADPVLHRGRGQAPPAVEGDSAKPVNPVTHKE